MPSIILSDNGVSSGSAGLKSTAASDGALALQTTTAGGTATTAVSIDTSQNVTFAGYANLPNTFGFKNRIINGAMVIDQRNAGASVTITNTSAATYTVDRWAVYGSAASKFSVQQNAGSVSTPAGFSNYLGITSLSAYAVAAGDYFTVQQRIEGFNTADLAWGTANAQAVTLSFRVYSSLTGTFGGSIQNSAQNRSYPFSYSIPVANTWTTITVTIPGDQTGTWVGATNGIGLYVFLGLGVGSTYGSGTAGAWTGSLVFVPTGSVSVVGTNGATFYITGVQLEKGSTATSFDFRPYGTELQLCQRYYQQIGKSNNVSYQPYTTGVVTSSTATSMILNLPVVMRATPTFTFNGATNTFVGTSGTSATSVASDIMSPATIMYSVNVASGLTTGNGARHYQNAANASSLELSSEL